MNAPTPIRTTYTYKLSRTDLFVSRLITVRYNKFLNGMVLLIILLAVVMSFVGKKSALPQYSLGGRIVASVMWSVIMLVIVSVFHLFTEVINLLSGRFKCFLVDYALVLTDEGLIVRTENSETLYRWRGIYRIRETSRYLYLFVSVVHYHTIPKRAFSSQGEIIGFLDEIKERTKNAEQCIASNVGAANTPTASVS